MNQRRVSWRYGSVFAALIVAALCTYEVTKADVNVGNSAVIVTLGLVVLCMATERGRWQWWKRFLFVPVVFIAAAALKPLAIPIAIYAMWQSRLFVEPKKQPSEKGAEFRGQEDK